jgi:hypothetical protein
MDPLTKRYINTSGLNSDEITKPNSQIFSNASINLDFGHFTCFISQGNGDGSMMQTALEEDCIASE